MESKKTAGSLAKFLRLPKEEKDLLIEAVLILWVIRLGLWSLPFSMLVRIIDKVVCTSLAKEKSSDIKPEKLAWFIEIGSRYAPRATCLVKALAGRVLLSRGGYSSSLCIGVARGEGNSLEAHAWLKHQGSIILGKSDRKYAQLPDFIEKNHERGGTNIK